MNVLAALPQFQFPFDPNELLMWGLTGAANTLIELLLETPIGPLLLAFFVIGWLHKKL